MPTQPQPTLTGACSCGALTVACSGSPVRVSVCHCRDCKRRTGSAFSWNARFARTDVRIGGQPASWSVQGPSGAVTTRQFCPRCSAIVAYSSDADPDVVAIPCGCLDDPGRLVPHRTAWAERREDWVEITAAPMEFGH